MGFLRDPQQGATFIDFVTIFGRTCFFNRQTGCKLDETARTSSEAIVSQFGDHFTVTNLAARDGIQAITGAIFRLKIPKFTGMIGFFQQFEIFEGHRRGDDLDLSRITNGIA